METPLGCGCKVSASLLQGLRPAAIAQGEPFLAANKEARVWIVTVAKLGGKGAVAVS